MALGICWCVCVRKDLFRLCDIFLPRKSPNATTVAGVKNRDQGVEKIEIRGWRSEIRFPACLKYLRHPRGCLFCCFEFKNSLNLTHKQNILKPDETQKMKILNEDNKLFYLKSVNLNEQSNTISLLFRQEFLFFLTKDSAKYLQDYQNVLLMLYFDDQLTASENFKLLKDLYLDDTISIDEIGPKEIEFIGKHDLIIKVTNCVEQVIDQFTEDWVERYKYASQCYFDTISKNNELHNLMNEIKIVLETTKIQYQDNAALDVLYHTIIEKIKIHENNLWKTII
jgi:hypothetical protein